MRNGWLDKKENSFKLHQIIKEYLKKQKKFILYISIKEVNFIIQFIKEIKHNIKKEEKLNYQKRGKFSKD